MSPIVLSICSAFSIKLEIQFAIAFSAQLPKKMQPTQRAIASVLRFVPLVPSLLFVTSISGIGESINITTAIMGRAAQKRVR